MARQLLVDYLPFEITREQIAESLKENNGRLIVHGVLQRSDAKNQNGRVYPKDSPLSSGKIELKYMTAREEDILTSQNLLKKGTAIDMLLKSLINNN